MRTARCARRSARTRSAGPGPRRLPIGRGRPAGGPCRSGRWCAGGECRLGRRCTRPPAPACLPRPALTAVALGHVSSSRARPHDPMRASKSSMRKASTARQPLRVDVHHRTDAHSPGPLVRGPRAPLPSCTPVMGRATGLGRCDGHSPHLTAPRPDAGPDDRKGTILRVQRRWPSAPAPPTNWPARAWPARSLRSSSVTVLQLVGHASPLVDARHTDAPSGPRRPLRRPDRRLSGAQTGRRWGTDARCWPPANAVPRLHEGR